MAIKTEYRDPTPQEEAVLAMVRRHLIEARQRKRTGKLTFEIDLHDGGVTNRWTSTRFRELGAT
jgi:hypothetical protein